MCSSDLLQRTGVVAVGQPPVDEIVAEPARTTGGARPVDDRHDAVDDVGVTLVEHEEHAVRAVAALAACALGGVVQTEHGRGGPAAQDPAAPERDYFRFDPDLQYGYECWFNVPTLPKFDHTSAGLRDRLVLDEASPVRRWLREGLDGWRVDVANMAGRMGSVDVTHEFARDVRAAMAAEGGDTLLLAEHGHDASADLLGDGWHGTMNYAGFTRQVWCWLRSPDFHEIGRAHV